VGVGVGVGLGPPGFGDGPSAVKDPPPVVIVSASCEYVAAKSRENVINQRGATLENDARG